MSALEPSLPALYAEYQDILDGLFALSPEVLDARAGQVEADAGGYLTQLCSALVAPDVGAATRDLVARQTEAPRGPYLVDLHEAAIALAFGQWDAAIQSAVRASQAPVRNPALGLIVGEAQRRKGAFTEAFHNLSQAAGRLRFADRARTRALDSLTKVEAVCWSEALERGALAYLARPDRAPAEIGSLVCSLLRHKYPSVLSPSLADFSADGLLTTALERMVLCDPEVEQLLVGIRSRVLDHVLRHQTFDAPTVRLIIALAHHADATEHAHVVPEHAKAAVRALAAAAAQMLEAGLPRDGVAAMALLIACFEPLDAVGVQEELRSVPVCEWPEPVQGLMTRLLHERAEVERLGREVPSLTDVRDPVSLAVRNQYEAHPYPRWRTVRVEPALAPYVARFEARAPRLTERRRETGRTRMLVAGCGTGKQPIELALRHPELDITAIDLSRTSLGYARWMAERAGASNIRFFHADILELIGHAARYDVIECAGVLHHMENPEAGLAALRSLLAPQGILQLALYSRLARREVIAFRQAHRPAPNPSRDDVRQVRWSLIRAGGHPTLLASPDFYTTSACRDLLMHVQEHQHTLLEIQTLLERHALAFRGFAFPAGDPVIQSFTEEEGAHALESLPTWARFEARHPDTFAAMYQLFAQAA